MKKIVLSLVCIGLFSSSLLAEDMGVVKALASVAETKIKEDAKVAIQKKSKVTVDGGSKIEAKSKIGNDNVVVGAVGTVVAIGEEVEISGSDIRAKSDIGNDNVVVGTSGAVVLGAH